MPKVANDILYLQRQLRSAKGVVARQRKDLIRLRAELADLKAQAPLNNKLIVLLRLGRATQELLVELLDKREAEHIKVDHDVKGPYTHPNK